MKLFIKNLLLKLLFAGFFSSLIYFILSPCLFAAVHSAQPSSNVQSLDKIVAIVNDDVITQSELNKNISITRKQMEQSHAVIPSDSVLTKQVLDQLINKKLQLQVAKQAGVKVSDNELNKAISDIAENNHVSTASLYVHLQQDGISKDVYRDEIRDQITMHKVEQEQVSANIHLTKDEVARFLKSKSWKDNSAKEYHLEDILIPVADASNSTNVETAEQHALSLMEQYKNNKNIFSTAAVSNHDKMLITDLGWRNVAEMPSEFVDRVTHMNIKELAGPIRTDNGFHILLLTEVRDLNANQPAPTQKEIEQLLLQRKFNEAVQTWVSKLRDQAFINIQIA